ncbi:MAG: phosphocholine cytidylyltransferase family protein [Methanobacteriota archaeon]
MKAAILAAGIGSRFKKYAEKTPKTLLKIGDAPILHYILNSLSKLSISESAIITGFEAVKIKRFAGNGGKWGINLKYIQNPHYKTTNNIYSLYLAKDYLSSHGFLIINSDTFFHEKILFKLYNSVKKGITLAIDAEKELEEEGMKVLIEGNKIKMISKNISSREASGEYIGLARIDRRFSNIFFESIENAIKSKGAAVFYEEAFQNLIKNGHTIYYQSTEGLPWIEIDTPADLQKAKEIAPMVKNF